MNTKLPFGFAVGCIVLLCLGFDVVNMQAQVNPGINLGNQGALLKADLTIGSSGVASETTMGALIPRNDDWDEKQRGNPPAPGAMGPKVADIDTDTIVETDDDLVEGTVKLTINSSSVGNQQQITNLSGKWVFEFPGDKIRVWALPVLTNSPQTYKKITSGAAFGVPGEAVPTSITLQENASADLNLLVEGKDVTGNALFADKLVAKFVLDNGQTGGQDAVGYTVFKINLTANVSELDEEFPGAPVRLNDDNDNGNHFRDVSGTDTSLPAVPFPNLRDLRPLEPAWDMLEKQTVAGENDLMAVNLKVEPATLEGNVVLKAEIFNIELTDPETGDPTITDEKQIVLWQTATKGAPVSEIVIGAGKTYAIAELPKTLYLEGADIGNAGFKLIYTFNGIEYKDELQVNVVTLHPLQGGEKMRVIYDYGKEIKFTVKGGSPDYLYKWDINGNDTPGEEAIPYEKLSEPDNTARVKTIQFSQYEDAVDNIFLPRTFANRRKQDYETSVELQPSGLILNRPIRIALNQQTGTAMPAQTTAALQNRYQFSDENPVRFNTVPLDFLNSPEWSWLVIPDDPNQNRIIYLTGLNTTPEHQGTYGLTLGAHGGNTVAGTRATQVYVVLIDDLIWTEGWHREELDSAVAHESLHCFILDQRRQKWVPGPNGTMVDEHNDNVWRKLYSTRPDEQADNFNEAICYLLGNLNDTSVEWLFLLPPDGNVKGGNILESFARFYKNACDLVPNLPVSVKAQARTLLQEMYQILPFAEMKRHMDYDSAKTVRPPQ